MFETDGYSLDPKDWDDFRHQAHKMLDDMLDYSQNLRNQHVWQAMPPEVLSHLQALLPEQDLAQAHHFFMEYVLPYAVGNAHPRFMGWVHGGGTPVGMIAEMLAAGLNANVGGRNQAPVEIERQLTRWVIELFHFPETASGLFVTGTSMANLMGCLCARTQMIGPDVRVTGLTSHLTLSAYTSTSAHVCIEQAMDICGLGSQSLRKISVNDTYQMNIDLLVQQITEDKQSGKTPFLIVATVGSVDVGAIDNLTAIADLCQREKIWFHVDGAFGALAMLAPTLSPHLAGIERADSIAFDFHK
jgi:glutamate/tyrosine decarboxylase-like PLP-dependent enzyme